MVRLLKSDSQIVVVDARPGDYRDLPALAGSHRWQLHFLATGRSAMAFMPRTCAQLWMINTWLPDMSGFALFDVLQERTAGATAFLVSDRYDPRLERLACRKGAALYLGKGAEQSIDCQSLLRLLVTADTASKSAAFPLELGTSNDPAAIEPEFS